MIVLDREREVLEGIDKKINNLKSYLQNENFVPNNQEINYWYSYLTQIKRIVGNFDNDISFIACLMAKEFLCKKHKFKSFDVSLKSQSAPGLDIDEVALEGDRIIGEIKTTISYKETDLGAKQKEMFFKDFDKLRENEAKYKYFFVTEIKTFNIVLKRYLDRLNGVTIVLLPQALSEEGDKFVYSCNNIQELHEELESNYNIKCKNELIEVKDIKLSDIIRKSIYDNFIKPQKDLGNSEILVKASDIHKLLKLNNRYPAVCSAMYGKKIEIEYGVKILKKEGNYGASFSVLYRF